jgi:predicted DNA-binding transcriptional regulator AlpA
MPRQTALPPSLAPRLIDREASAAYVCVSPNTFDEMVARKQMPKARVLSVRRFAWDTRELDAAIDALPHDGEDESLVGVDEGWKK